MAGERAVLARHKPRAKRLASSSGIRVYPDQKRLVARRRAHAAPPRLAIPGASGDAQPGFERVGGRTGAALYVDLGRLCCSSHNRSASSCRRSPQCALPQASSATRPGVRRLKYWIRASRPKQRFTISPVSPSTQYIWKTRLATSNPYVAACISGRQFCKAWLWRFHSRHHSHHPTLPNDQVRKKGRCPFHLGRPLPTADIGYPVAQFGRQPSDGVIAQPAVAGRPKDEVPTEKSTAAKESPNTCNHDTI